MTITRWDFAVYDFTTLKLVPQVTDPIKILRGFYKHKKEFDSFEIYSILINCATFYLLLCKIIFNLCTRKKNKTLPISFDIWTKIDTVSAICTVVTMRFIVMSSPEELMPDLAWKKKLNYIVTANAVLQYFRCFSFLLVVESLSKMILTFINMIIDTLPFLFLLTAFMLLMTSVAATLFQDVNPAGFGSFLQSFFTLKDSVIAGTTYSGFAEKEKIFSVFAQLTTLFGNVLMLNYLVAILSKTYENMLEYGSFLYKVKKFQYCQRY